MRILLALLPVAVLASACATRPAATSSTAPVSASASPSLACEVARVPAGAVFGVREGVEIATWPPEMPRAASACQRVWYGDRQRPEAMQVLATYYFASGHVLRLTGRVPGGAAYDCHYRDGTLDTPRSQNPAQCPKASEIEAGRR